MKSLFTTKTFWFNVISGLTTFFAMPEIRQVMAPEYLVLITALINIVLRYITSVPVTLTGAEPA